MADATLQDWKGDFALAPNGDLALVDGSDETRERIIRRLFTSVRGYVWHQDYGAGLPDRIGNPAKERVIQAIVRSQIQLEATVAKIPVPTISVTASAANAGLFVITINYTDAVTGAASAIRLQVPERA